MALEERLQRLGDAGRAEEPTTVELSLKQWVEHNGRLVLGGSNDTECFKTVVVNDEQELEMQVRVGRVLRRLGGRSAVPQARAASGYRRGHREHGWRTAARWSVVCATA